jgi:MYXO-CTERM domain-containing protein
MRTDDYFSGDCDRDGLSNRNERNAGTDECAPAQPIGVAGDDATCTPLVMSCILGSTCAATPGDPPSMCVQNEAGSGTSCQPQPPESALYCCSGRFECPQDGDLCIDTAGGGELCVPDDCAGIATIDPIDCITFQGEIVPFPEGDCDEDGTPNGGDLTHCGVVLMPDAGPIGSEDAGGGATEDAGDNSIEPRFEGGGGCACRAAPGESFPWALALMSVFVLWRRRG